MQNKIQKIWCMGVVLILACMFVRISAKEFIWSGGENGVWNDPRNYENGVEGGELPSDTDEVWIPSATMVTIDVFNEESFGVFSNVLRIRPTDDTSVIVFDIPQGVTSVVNCAINKNSWSGANTGKVIKRGAGALQLTSSARFRNNNDNGRDNYVNYSIEEGTLIFPQNVEHESYRGYYGYCDIAEGATLIIEDGESVRTYIYGINGGGTITSLSKSNKLLVCSGIEGEFSGKILSPIKWYSSGRVMLTGTESTMEGEFQHMNLHTSATPQDPFMRTRGVVGVAKIGMKGNPSSTGTGDSVVFRDDAAALIYLGEGETTDKKLVIGDTTKGPAYLDAGAYGGINWLGEWGKHSTAKAENLRLVLTGSNIHECVFSGILNKFQKDGNDYDFIISKQGTGTWHFADTADNSANRTFGGPIKIEEGVFRFDSLEEKGVACSVGTAERYAITPDGVLQESEAYAFHLGGGAALQKDAVLEYAGTDVRPFSAACSCERKIGLYGNGIVRANGNWVGISGVSGASEGNHTLILDGTSTTHNVISDISDGRGKVSVEKRGAGTWAIGRDLSFSGSINVREGKLLVRPADGYSWFRWTVKANTSTYTNGTESLVIAQELGFFNASGYRQGIGITTNSSVHHLNCGEVALDTCYGYDPKISSNGESRELFNLFDDKRGDPGWMISLSDAPGKNSGGYRPRVSMPDTWLPVVVRMPADSDTIASWDWSYTLNLDFGTYNRVPMIYTLEGSVDGLNWDLLSYHDVFVEPAGRHMWRFSGKNCETGSASSPYIQDGVLQGEQISNPSADAYSTLDNITGISIAANASLVSDGKDISLPAGITLTVDGNGNGLIRGFIFPNNGTVNLVNWDYESTFSSFDFSNSSSWENLAGWNFTINGDETSKYKIKVSENGFTLIKPALKIVIR